MPLITYIFTIGCFLFLIFGIHMLLIKYGNTFLNKLLAVVLLSRACQLIYILLVTSGKLAFLPFLVRAFNPLYFAAPACLYLYFKGFIKDENSLKKWEWLHFLPLLFAGADMIPWFTMSSQAQQITISEIVLNKSFFIASPTGIVPNYINLLSRTVLSVVYILFSWCTAIRFNFIKKPNTNYKAKTWILFLLVTSSSVQLITLIPFVAKLILGYHTFDAQIYLLYAVATSIVVLGMVIFVLYNPKILYGYLFLAVDYNKEKNKIPTYLILDKIAALAETADKKAIRNITTTTLDEKEQLYLLKINDLMKTQKPFLDASFSIAALSQNTEIPPHHCSYIINYVLKTSFRDWINSYRIDYFIAQYPTKSKSNTIVAVALECGFNNKVTFYNAFTKVKGVVPTEYFI